MNVLVFAGGPEPAVHPSRVPHHDLVIAADRGADHARDLGLRVDVLVGDLDSASARARLAAAEIVAFPVDKDASDLELALDVAVERGATEIDVVMSTLGRTDHALIAMLLLASTRYRSARIRAITSTSVLHVVWDEVQLDVVAGQLVSIVAPAGPAIVTTSGLDWPLDQHVLEVGSSLGLSNRASGRGAAVAISDGVGYVIVDHDNG